MQLLGMVPGRTARWRHRRSAVSPVIAIILLVAITVVLAAVLYVLVAGLVHTGTAAVPLGTAFYAGPAGQFTGTKTTKSYCESGHFCYSVPIDQVGSGLVLGNLNFRVIESTGSIHVVSANYAMISIVNESGTVVAYTEVSKNTAFVVTDWEKYTKGDTYATPLTDSQVIWVQFGNTKTSPFDQGMSLQVLGSDGYSGSVTVSLP